MAHAGHLAILRKGVEVWNRWRKANPEVSPNLRNAYLEGANLRGTNLTDADLTDADLTGANLTGANLEGADFRNANLTRAELSRAYFYEADCRGTYFTRANLTKASLANTYLRGAYFEGANLSKANLYSVDLSEANLEGANLSLANLSSANLSDTKLREADLTGADFSTAYLVGANLTNTNLTRVRILDANLTGATLTGACIQDWHINANTNLEDVICDYVYLRQKSRFEFNIFEDWLSVLTPKTKFEERRPSDPTKNFAPGEFTKLFQKAHETVDLIFRNGVDWQALLISLDKLRVEADGAEFPIQAIENKDDGDFVVRLKTPPEANKAEVEKFIRQEYETQLRLLENQYRTQLQAKDEQIEIYRQQSADLKDITRMLANRPVIITNTNNNTVEANAVSNSQSSGDTYNGTIKATNFAPHGTAIGGTFNDYSQNITNNLDEIQQLITTLRSQVEQFPPDARDDADVHLGDLEDDLKHPDKHDPKRIKAKLMALLAIAVGLGGAIATATDFSNNVLELGKKFGVELVHPQGTQSPQAPHSQGTSTVDVQRLEGGSR